MAPMVDTVVYMQWLYKQCKDKGCRFVHDEIKGLLRDQAEDLKRKYKAQLIFNCSGLSAKELAGDEDVYPLRGKLFLLFILCIYILIQTSDSSFKIQHHDKQTPIIKL